MLKIEAFMLLPAFQTNTWLIWDETTKQALLIDPSAPDSSLLELIQEHGLKVQGIVNTHGHGDHIGGNSYFQEALACPIMIHEADQKMLVDNKKNLSEFMGTPLKLEAADRLLKDGDILTLGTHDLKVIHTPGHTPGGICLLSGKFLISGDTLFEMSIGRTDFPRGSHDEIIDSIKNKLFILPDDTVVFPGHGPRTTIGMEKLNNPFVR
ncbi:MAG: MBL fold metallo-hydrolase [Candidatus Cloacimonetes bacterium]|jgi:glyoxylase-like metal-dependent hydrolase (beta-lactamase superfamily II)|nr:MBL fold metallo-hydrolase [Candidatus Cloacimonadota bacterium]MDY0173007.1 MBL fold metallo-hydrolase [Candidatus Cloacimonadaceae bacterium]